MWARGILPNLGFSILILIFGWTFGTTAWAGGAFSTTPGGEPVLWDVEVVWNPENGALKGEEAEEGGGGGSCNLIPDAHAQATISNNEGIQLINDAFNVWKNVAGAQITITQGPALDDGGNVNAANIQQFWSGGLAGGGQGTNDPAGCYDSDNATPCIRPVIFDATGLVTEEVLGACAQCGVFGFAAILPERANDNQGTITKSGLRSAQAVISGACVEPAIQNPVCGTCCSNLGITKEDLFGTVVHELGHFLSLDHTLVNPNKYLQCVGGGCGESDLQDIPTMIGFAVPGADLSTLHQDDKSTFAHMYAANPGQDCSISGTVTINGGNGRCLEVVARKTTDLEGYAVGFVAGAEVDRNSQGVACAFSTPSDIIACNNADPNEFQVPDNCTLPSAQCGQYTIGGLESGSYKIGAHFFQVNGDASQPIAFAIEPCNPVLLGVGIFDVDLTLTGQPSSGMIDVTLNCPEQKTGVNLDL